MKDRNCMLEEEHKSLVIKAKEATISQEDMEKICKIFHLLSEPSRMKIVLALMQGEMCVYHLQEVCGAATISGISHQLRILKDNGILKARRLGKNIEYAISDEHVCEIVNLALKHLSCENKGFINEKSITY